MAKKSNSSPEDVWREARVATDIEAQKAIDNPSEIPVVSGDDPNRVVEGLEAFIGPNDPFVRATFEFSKDPEVRPKQVAALRFALAAFLKVYPGSAQLVGTAQSCAPCPSENAVPPLKTKKPKKE